MNSNNFLILTGFIENNRFTDVGKGIVVSSPLNTCVIRKNYVDTKDDSCPPIYNQDKASDLVKTIIKP